MKQETIKITPQNLIYYFIGFVLVGLGVNLMDYSGIGMGAWDTVTFNMHAFFTNIVGISNLKVGWFSMGINVIIFLSVLLYRRRVGLLMMIVPVLLVGQFINLWRYQILGEITTDVFYQQVLLFVFGLTIIPVGLALVVKSTFPAFVFEEWTFMMADIFKTNNFGRVRLGIEITGITIGAIFGFLTFYASEGHLGSVNFGSLIAAIVFGRLVAFFLKVIPNTTINTTSYNKVLMEIPDVKV